jgi:hypothetical protein
MGHVFEQKGTLLEFSPESRLKTYALTKAEKVFPCLCVGKIRAPPRPMNRAVERRIRMYFSWFAAMRSEAQGAFTGR